MSTQDLEWLLVRNSNSFLVKQRGIGRVFSREPGNLTSLHSYKHSGIINDKSVGITPAPNTRGVVLTTQKTKVAPGTVRNARNSVTIKGGSRRVARAVANSVAKRGYRPDLRRGTYMEHALLPRARPRDPARGHRPCRARAAAASC